MAEGRPYRPVRVVGVGGGGCRAIERASGEVYAGVAFLAVDTYRQGLAIARAGTRLLIGETLTRGLGAGGSPETGRQAAEHDSDVLDRALDGADRLFVVAMMGGGTGTGAAPVIARLGQALGVPTVGFVVRPYSYEGERRRQIARTGIRALRETVDTLVVIDGDRLLRFAADDPPPDQLMALAAGALAWQVLARLLR